MQRMIVDSNVTSREQRNKAGRGQEAKAQSIYVSSLKKKKKRERSIKTEQFLVILFCLNFIPTLFPTIPHKHPAMVKFITIAAIVLPAILSMAQAVTPVGQFVLSAGQLKGTHTIKKIDCKVAVGYYGTGADLKAGGVFCNYLPASDMSLCQSHTADVSADFQNKFTNDILSHLQILGGCKDKSGGGVNFANDGAWINGFYSHDVHTQDFSSAATFSKGKVTINTVKPFGCSYASQGLSWRNLATVSPTC